MRAVYPRVSTALTAFFREQSQQFADDTRMTEVDGIHESRAVVVSSYTIRVPQQMNDIRMIVCGGKQEARTIIIILRIDHFP